MQIIRFAAAELNCIDSDSERYVLFRDRDGLFYLMPTTCPHRGGPLYLGHCDPERRIIECPWHKSRLSVPKLARSALPTIVSRGQVTAVVPAAGGRQPVVTRRKALFQAPRPPDHDGRQEAQTP